MTEVERIARPIISASENGTYAILGGLAKLPLGIVSQLVDHNMRFVALERGEEFIEASSTVRCWSEDMRAYVKDARGLFVHEDRTVYLRQVTPLNLIVHEAGHAIDMTLGVGLESRSRRDPIIVGEFKRAQERNAFITPKAAEHVGEFFAEAVRAHAGVGEDVSREKLFDLHPHTCVAIDRCFARAERKLLNRNRWFSEAYHGLTEDGRSYSGGIVDAVDGRIVQELGRGQTVTHESADLNRIPRIGEQVNICYDCGRGVVTTRELAEVEIAR